MTAQMCGVWLWVTKRFLWDFFTKEVLKDSPEQNICSILRADIISQVLLLEKTQWL